MRHPGNRATGAGVSDPPNSMNIARATILHRRKYAVPLRTFFPDIQIDRLVNTYCAERPSYHSAVSVERLPSLRQRKLGRINWPVRKETLFRRKDRRRPRGNARGEGRRVPGIVEAALFREREIAQVRRWCTSGRRAAMRGTNAAVIGILGVVELHSLRMNASPPLDAVKNLERRRQSQPAMMPTVRSCISVD